MNILFRPAAVAISLSAFVCLSSATHAQNFYKWVDSKGTTHYTQTPPPKGAKTTGQVRTFAGPATTQIQERTDTPVQQQNETPNNVPVQTPEQQNSTPTQITKKTIEVERT